MSAATTSDGQTSRGRGMTTETARHTIDLAEAASRDDAGGKARNLARALAAGHRVPAGFVVLAGGSSGVPRSELDARLEALGPGPFAVRSSAAREDSAARSFAGQLETELGVHRDEVAGAVARCVASGEALRVLRYAGDAGGVAVLVQSMVPAERAGVAFSADPRTGERGVVVLEAVRGLGDTLVSGEASPEAWRAQGERTTRTRTASDGAALDEAQATQVAALARAMEELFGAPQDVEWAFAGGELYLLQSRPITALPAEPVPIDDPVPAGTWERDDHHGVLSPLGWAWFAPYPRAMAARMRELGVPVKEMRAARISGHLYMQMVSEGGDGDRVPPRWVLWLVSRLLPSLRRAAKTAEAQLVREGYWGLIERWESELRPALQRETEALFVEDPTGLSNEALLAKIRAALAHSARGLALHAELHEPPMFGLGNLALFVEDELGWAPERAVTLVAGSSGHTTELHRSVERAIAAHERELAGREFPRTWGALLRTAPGLGEALAEWMRDHRLRVAHYDPRHATLGERPEMVLSVAESVVRARREPRPEAPSPADALTAEARAKLAPARFAEFERLLARARRAYALRDENGVETVSRPAGLLRHFVLELGRRIEGDLGAREHAVYLTPDEHERALARTLPNVGALVTRRRGEESWALRRRGPLRYGKAPAPMPPVDAFPPALARLFRIFAWTMGVEATREDTGPGPESLKGLGVGTRTVTARARVIERPEELSSLRHGEVLVCRITSPEWSVALGRVAAVVTNEGGLLSHPAIIAREYDVPAVVGAPGATREISTGDTVRVDPVEGAVTVVTKVEAQAER